MTLLQNLPMFALLMLALHAPAYGQQDSLTNLSEEELEIEAEKAGYQMAQMFSRCAAFYDAMRDYALELGEPDMAQLFNDQSNGSEITAEVFANVYAKIEKYEQFVASNYDVEYPGFRMLLKHGGMSDSQIQRAAADCQTLQPIQNEVVEEVRKKAYGADTSDNKWVK